MASLYFDEWPEDRTDSQVAWLCDECGETMRGEPNTQGQCGYCGEWQDAPDGSGLRVVGYGKPEGAHIMEY